VHEYVLRFQAAGLGWPLPAGWGEAELVAALHPVSAPAARPPSRAQLSSPACRRDAGEQTHTLQLRGRSTVRPNPPATPIAVTVTCIGAG